MALTEHDWFTLLCGVLIGLSAIPVISSFKNYLEVKRDIAEARRIPNDRTDD